MTGSQFFGRSGGSLASIASSGQAVVTGGPACGNSPGTKSAFVCGLSSSLIQTVNYQSYVPSPRDISPQPACRAIVGP